MLRLAHRGDWRHAPENSLAAFRAAMAIPGCDGVELDVRLSGEGTPVVLHDETLSRVQRRPGRVGALRDAELAAAGVPTLAAALAAVPAGAFLDVELKADNHGAGTGAALRAARGESPDRAVVSSFDVRILARVGGSRPGWRRWLNVRDLRPATIEIASGLGCVGVACAWRAINERGIDRVRTAGLVLAAWTVSNAVTSRRLERAGIEAVVAEGEALDRS